MASTYRLRPRYRDRLLSTYMDVGDGDDGDDVNDGMTEVCFIFQDKVRVRTGYDGDDVI